MPYTINYLEAGRVTGIEHWEDSFGLACDLARRFVGAGTVDGVEIRDERGTLLFHYPESMKVA